MPSRPLAQLKMIAEAFGNAKQNRGLLMSGEVKGVRFEMLAKICEVLGCHPGDLSEAVQTN